MAGPTSEEPAPQANAVHTVRFEDGSTLEFYEPSYGLVVLSGETPLGIVPANEKYDLSGGVVELFRRLKPNEPVPAALVALGAREAEMAEAWAASQLESLPDGPMVEAPAVSSDTSLDRERMNRDSLILKHPTRDWFAGAFCTTAVLGLPATDQRIKEVAQCRLDVTGTGTFNNENLAQGFAAAYPYRGNITLTARSRVFPGGGAFALIGSWAVPEANYRWVETRQGNGPRLTLQYQLSNSDGDGFHFAIVRDRYFCGVGCFFGNGCLCPI